VGNQNEGTFWVCDYSRRARSRFNALRVAEYNSRSKRIAHIFNDFGHELCGLSQTDTDGQQGGQDVNEAETHE